MPGFRCCQWCEGKGCIACDAEAKKYAEKAMVKAPKWREPDIRDVRDQALRDETRRLEGHVGAVGSGICTQEQFNDAEAAAHAAIEEAFKPALDAEYARQFPGGPRPSFVASLDNPADMALLKKFAGPEAIKAAFSDGGSRESVAKLHDGFDQATLIQSARAVLCPNDQDQSGDQ